MRSLTLLVVSAAAASILLVSSVSRPRAPARRAPSHLAGTPAILTPSRGPSVPPQTHVEARESDQILSELSQSTFELSADRQPVGVCKFLPANAHDAAHVAELQSVLATWADDATIVFTEKRAVFGASYAAKFLRVLANLSAWRDGHHRRVLSQAVLRKRGATPASLAGRGELSLPMFYWMWTARDALLHRCEWFFKTDTDTFLRPGALSASLRRFDSRDVLYAGMPMTFRTTGYNISGPAISFEYMIGGPSYGFSKGAMGAVEMRSCFRCMAEEPILLIHDDAGTGYCMHGHTPGVERVSHGAAMAGTNDREIGRFFRYAAEVDAMHCPRCSVAIHPASASALRLLHDRLPDTSRRSCRDCQLKLMHGEGPDVGANWHVPPDLQQLIKYWRYAFVKDLDVVGVPWAEARRITAVRNHLISAQPGKRVDAFAPDG